MNFFSHLSFLVGVLLVANNSVGSPAELRRADYVNQEKNIKIIYSRPLQITGAFERRIFSGLEYSILSEEQFFQVYTQLKERDFANKFKDDGCYAKAHLISYELSRVGIAHAKALVYGKQVGDIKIVEPEKTYLFEFHISPLVVMRSSDGQLRMMVLDFSFFQNPIDLENWNSSIFARSNKKNLTSLVMKPENIDPTWNAGSHTLYGNDLLYRFETEIDAFKLILSKRKAAAH